MKIETEIILPFRLPVQDGNQIISEYYFGQLHITFSTLDANADLDAQDIIPCRSVLKIVCFPKKILLDIECRSELQEMFVLNLVGYVNHMISAFRISHQLSYLYNITVYDLPSALVISVDGEKTIYLIVTPPPPPPRI